MMSFAGKFCIHNKQECKSYLIVLFKDKSLVYHRLFVCYMPYQQFTKARPMKMLLRDFLC